MGKTASLPRAQSVRANLEQGARDRQKSLDSRGTVSALVSVSMAVKRHRDRGNS